MGFFSSLCEGICSIGRGLWEGAKTVVGAIARVGPAVIAVAKPLVKALCVIAPQMGVPLNVVLGVAEKVVGIASVAAGIIGGNESVSEIGERALVAGEQGIHIEDYENPQEYMEIINQIQIPEGGSHWNAEECAMAGISTLAYALQVKFDISPEVYPLFVRYRQFFTDQRIKEYMDYAIKTDYDLGHLGDYFSTNSTMREKEAAREFMEHAEKANNKNFNAEKFDEQLLDAKLANPKIVLDKKEKGD